MIKTSRIINRRKLLKHLLGNQQHIKSLKHIILIYSSRHPIKNYHFSQSYEKKAEAYVVKSSDKNNTAGKLQSQIFSSGLSDFRVKEFMIFYHPVILHVLLMRVRGPER